MTAAEPSAEPAAAQPVVVRAQRFGGSGNPAVALDVWRVPGARRQPVLVLVHGGGWRSGRREDWELHGWARTFARAGFVVVAPSYRLACATGPDDAASALCGSTMGDARTDVRNAVLWTIDNAARFGGDPRGIVLLGGSAGAQLALLTGSRREFVGRVRGVVAISPPVDLAYIATFRLWLSGAAEQAIGCSYATCPTRWREHSPRLVAADAALPPLVPLYLYSSRRDPRVPRPTIDAFARELARRGGEVVVREPWLASSGCHGPWACGRFRVSTTRHGLRYDITRWIRTTALA